MARHACSSSALARVAPNRVLLHHRFHVSSDEDWAYFMATAGYRYVIETLNLACNAHTQIAVYDDTDPPTKNAEDIDSGYDNNSYLLWQAPHEGRWYIRVLQPYGRVDYGAGTRYDLQITDVTGW